MIDRLELLARMSNAIGVGGRESEVRDIVSKFVVDLGLEPVVDRLGNVSVTVEGNSAERLMIDAHMDEVGFMVATIDNSGFIRLGPLGTWDPRVLMSQRVVIQTRKGNHVHGVIGSVPPHVQGPTDSSKVPAIHELFVDVGATDNVAVASLGISVGDPVVPYTAFEQISDDLVAGKAFDDRAGCVAAMCVLHAIARSDARPPLTTVFSFATSEEVGLRGARVAAQQINPSVALAIEGTTAVDVPGVAPTHISCRFGRGAAVTIADRSVICDADVIQSLERIAGRDGIAMQHKIPVYAGGTNAAVIQLTGAGVKTGVVSVPCRYIHTSASLMRPSDLDAVIDLVTGFVWEADQVLTG